MNMELRQGSTLQSGKYRIIHVIGQGGFGITYLAEHTRLKKQVAIKEFFPKTFCGRNDTTSQVHVGTEANTTIVSHLKRKFLKEAQNLAKLDCPYIVRITDVFEENDTAYYVMDYIEGRSLADIVKSSGPLPVSKAIGYITKIGQALEYIHTKRINHLDVKPANIMVWKKDDSPVLIDFGLSKQYDTAGIQTSTTPVGISHGYAPIEQYSDGGVKEFSPRTDVYALGATLYYLLSGKTPDQAPNLISQGLAFPPSIPESLRGPIRKAMSAGRQDRYPTVSSFIEAIGANTVDVDANTRVIQPEEVNITSSTVVTPPVDPVRTTEPDKKPVYKQGWLWLIGLVVLLLPIICVGLVEYLHHHDEHSESVATSPGTVTDMYYESVLGACYYTGEVDGNSKPNGLGTAKFISDSIASSYDGEWIHGDMNGQAKEFVMGNGDVFKGIFRDNKFSSGRYKTTDGDYYEGTFVDEQPYMGAWYDKSGRRLSKVIKGKES